MPDRNLGQGIDIEGLAGGLDEDEDNEEADGGDDEDVDDDEADGGGGCRAGERDERDMRDMGVAGSARLNDVFACRWLATGVDGS